jgi:Asp-tRNA(Asn)/Glu-tRNA(Gln) amidotransferase A subunit family amidase
MPASPWRPGAAPVGLGWTGDPVFVMPGSMLGIPTVSLPVLYDVGLPLGLELMGFADRDAPLVAVAAAVLAIVSGT